MSAHEWRLRSGIAARTLLASCAFSSTLFPQEVGRVVATGESHLIPSRVMQEQRRVLVTLPESYERTAVGYPVLFMLDGTSHVLHATATSRFLSAARNRIPEMIVVVLPNTNRNRDLTPGPGAERFQRFFAEELFPWVDSTLAAEQGARIFAVRPNWSMPAPEWVAADPDFWRLAPVPRPRP
jgi:enterochelin esterase-like enzyme